MKKLFLMVLIFMNEKIFSSHMNLPQKRRKALSDREQIKNRMRDLGNRNIYKGTLLQKIGLDDVDILHELSYTYDHQEFIKIKRVFPDFNTIIEELEIETLDNTALKARITRVIKKNLKLFRTYRNMGLDEAAANAQAAQADHLQELERLRVNPNFVETYKEALEDYNTQFDLIIGNFTKQLARM